MSAQIVAKLPPAAKLLKLYIEHLRGLEKNAGPFHNNRGAMLGQYQWATDVLQLKVRMQPQTIAFKLTVKQRNIDALAREFLRKELPVLGYDEYEAMFAAAEREMRRLEGKFRNHREWPPTDIRQVGTGTMRCCKARIPQTGPR